MKSDLTICGGKIRVKTPYAPALIDRFRAIPGRAFDGVSKIWEFPAVRDVLLMVCDAVGVLPWMCSDEVRKLAGENGAQAVEKVALDMSVIDGHHFHTPPYEHQRRNLARLVQNPRWILCDEMGTGKSHAVANLIYRIARGHERYSTPYGVRPEGPMLIVCPKSVLSVWVEQLDQHGDTGCLIVEKTWRGAPPTKDGIYVANYERVLADAEAFLSCDWFLIVLDEIHRVKNFTAQTSRVIRKLTNKAKYVYGLSGTPAPNGLEDWFGVLSAVDPTLLPVNTKTAFENRYCVKTQLGSGGIWKVTGYRNVEELHGYISSITSRVTKSECLDLPEKVFSVRKVTLDGEQARIYRELKKDAVARLTPPDWSKSFGMPQVQSLHAMDLPLKAVPDSAQLTIANVLTESLRLLQVVGGFVPSDSGEMHEIKDKAKLSALGDVIDEVGDKQVVIWCAFRAEVSFLAEWLAKTYKAMVVTLTGEVSSEDREKNVEMFRTGVARFFIGTSAGGEGINGLTVSDTEVFYSRTWNLKDYLQQTDRLHRIGQKNSVSVINLVATGTVDERVSEALEKKQSMQELMLRRPEDLL